MGKGIFKNFWIKLISIAIAIVLWFFVNGEKPRNITFNIPLTPSAIPSGMVVKEIFPNKVNVTLRGKFGLILAQNPKMIKLNLPLTRISNITKIDTEVYCEISTSDIFVPPGIEVVKVEPNRCQVLIKKGDASTFY